ncbi:mitochondrial resolvase Ydc2 [Nemania sp. NC0429]|nr:mitochondrial resolvase Ydc2 [Nemania sp. NC0429]
MAARILAQPVIPSSLRAEQLKRLSFLCGLPLTGRKDELIARLTAAATTTAVPSPKKKSRPGPVVLSIDLGIRNLAFSLLTPVVVSSAPGPRKTTGAKSKKRDPSSASSSSSSSSSPSNRAGPPAINLHLWQRLSLLEGLSRPSGQKGNGEQDASDVGADTETDAVAVAAAFSPAALAKTANAFLRDTVLRLDPRPTHVLIERQRWRSGGAAAIQEWTVRVNTLEAMLHASLRTLRDVGAWDGDVVSVWPQRVGQLFLGGAPDLASGDPPPPRAKRAKRAKRAAVAEGSDGAESEEKKKTRRSTRKSSSEIKKLKIQLLGSWLGQEGLVVRPDNPGARRMMDAYREALNGAGRGRSKRSARAEAEGEGKGPALDRKLDDLTDSLMQGMAWLRWQENMALLRREGGVEKLLE